MTSRNDWLTSKSSRSGLALEIAPLDKPVLEGREWNVRYLDHVSTAGLREKYAAHSSVDQSAIREVDFVVGLEGLVGATRGHRFSTVLASHVIEHVPNPIRWLQEIHELCEDGGYAVFAIPDRLRCFDSLRRPTIPSDWLGAWLEDAHRPSPRNIIDALLGECSWQGNLTWACDAVREELVHNRQPALALEMAKAACESVDYYDVHCWVFQPPEFFHVLHQLAVLNLFQFEFDGYRETDGNEFLVRFVRNDSSTWQSRVGSLPLARIGDNLRLPAGFSVGDYLHLNPDLVAARVDPVRHWLEYGRLEGRRISSESTE